MRNHTRALTERERERERKVDKLMFNCLLPCGNTRSSGGRMFHFSTSPCVRDCQNKSKVRRSDKLLSSVPPLGRRCSFVRKLFCWCACESVARKIEIVLRLNKAARPHLCACLSISLLSATHVTTTASCRRLEQRALYGGKKWQQKS